MLPHTFPFLEFLLVFYQWQTVTKAQSLTNAVFWQTPVVFNTSDPLDQGSVVDSDSRLAVSQDFQVINTGADADYEHKRLLIDMSNGCSNSTNLSAIQQWNDQLLTSSVTQSLPKMALIERGECTWNRKVSAVNYLSILYHLNIQAMLIYDNNTHGFSNTSFELQPIGTGEPLKQAHFNNNNTPLPASRNITHMDDNDLFRNTSNASNSSSNYLSVYFTTNDHGRYLKRLNPSYSSYSSSSAKNSTFKLNLHQFYQITPYLSITLLNSNQNDDGDNNAGGGFSNLLATSKGYLSYIIALVAVFLIGVIFLRWWRLRRMRRQVAVENGQALHADYILQSRTDQVDPLPVPMVNALPIVYYSVDTINNATCVICLDDYVENKSQVRMLPCRHGFCVLCIDPWLTQKSTFCPICKHDCLPPDQREQREQRQYNTTSSGNHNNIDISDATTTLENGPRTVIPHRNSSDHNSYTPSINSHH
ncbi:hypothetical protein BCR42DRAFT_456297 [Absidia repens]|uniref:RING-type domain-containing protein n=1 Tax=Absidia repens TaxID=90262 RepID=A0A1X2I0C6_9FUNG|nr:hypothetical protein BCR42DRAFT_456297 [Absidia repens]